MSDRINKTLRFDARLIKQAELLAKADNRSLNNWIETLMMWEVGHRKEELEYLATQMDVKQSYHIPKEFK